MSRTPLTTAAGCSGTLLGAIACLATFSEHASTVLLGGLALLALSSTLAIFNLRRRQTNLLAVLNLLTLLASAAIGLLQVRRALSILF